MTTTPKDKQSKNNNTQDDHVLAQLYKQGANETSPAKLNSEIINYAAKANTSATKNNLVSSHFGGGWKVPLSLAASVVVVFALLIQLDQTPQQLELPPIPKISIPSEPKTLEETYSAEETMADDTSSLKRDAEKVDLDENRINQPTIQGTQSIEDKETEQQQTYRERVNQKDLLKKEELFDNSHLQSKSKTNESNSSKLSSPSTAKKQITNPIDNTLDNGSETVPAGAIQPRSINKSGPAPNLGDAQEKLNARSDNELDNQTENFSPIPVKDWLLMIEKLVAQKDYAEAARQLKKFKQAYPEVDMEDLDKKIP